MTLTHDLGTMTPHDPHAVTPRADLGQPSAVQALLHDLRQPLEAILLFAGAAGGDPVRRLEAIEIQAQWMAALVEEVLGSRPRRSIQCLDVSALTMAAVARARATARCELDFVGDPELYALVDEVGLGRAIACVVDNAIRAAGQGGHVLVTVSAHDHVIAISVCDDGPGPGRIEPHTCLGLTITRAALSSFGGTFELMERTVGGTCALITLPSLTMRVSTP
jgi:signal transduction histidine kinase